MSNRSPKRSYPVAEGLPIEQPEGENFFLASVIIETPEDPCWNSGFDIVGSWQTVSRTLSHYLAYDERARRSQIRIYQGDEARKFFQTAVREELRYQQQKRAQPNN